MEYGGHYPIFDFSKLRTYPLAGRQNKLTFDQLVWPDQVRQSPPPPREDIEHIAEHVVQTRTAGKHVFWMMGAHSIKLGHSPLIIDLVRRGAITLVATQGAGSIHDFELALIGETSEDVPRALPEGLFGMARETGQYMNDALAEGNRRQLGFGESLGRMILGDAAPYPVPFLHPEISVLAAAVGQGMPATVHATMGTDIIDQHPGFDGEAKGGCSGRDFAIFAAAVCDLAGGVVLNIGSAVTLPEVLLKAVSMAANVGAAPQGMMTADFDMRPADVEAEADPSRTEYYFRDLKSIAVRIPRAFDGHGHYVQGNFIDTVPQLWHALDRRL
jgi:hypothetical protein